MEDSYDDQYLEAGGHFEDYNLDHTDGASGIVDVLLCSVRYPKFSFKKSLPDPGSSEP
jgi:hypothetical protein